MSKIMPVRVGEMPTRAVSRNDLDKCLESKKTECSQKTEMLSSKELNKLFSSMPDDFTKTTSKNYSEIVRDNLFPNGELDKKYEKMSNDLNLDIAPKLILVDKLGENEKMGYNFEKNEIKINLGELSKHTHKIVKKSDIATNKSLLGSDFMPLVGSKNAIQNIAEIHNNTVVEEDDMFIVKRMNTDETKNYMLKKICKELAIANRYMIMRKSPEVGVKKVVLATHNDKVVDKFVKASKTEALYKKLGGLEQAQQEQPSYKNRCLDKIALELYESIENKSKSNTAENNSSYIDQNASLMAHFYSQVHH